MSEATAASPRTKDAPTQKPFRAWVGPPILAGGAYHDGPLLANRLGLQMARVATLNTAWRLRKRRVASDLQRYVDAYERDGVVVIEDFLPTDTFAAIQAECRDAHAAGLFKAEVVEDNEVVEESLVPKRHKDRMRATWLELSRHEELKRTAAAILRRPSLDKLQIEVNFMRKSRDAPPPSRMIGTHYLHADVHYPSVKAWLYLNDIEEANGAFIYAKGSHKLSLARLAYEYDVSVRVAKAKREGRMYTEIPAALVRMPNEKQLRAMGLTETSICGRPNTLVFADVMGFHRRGDFVEGRTREQIQIQFYDRPARRASNK